jgi:DNA invertase Pin-like site-specific DNA recombinase
MRIAVVLGGPGLEGVDEQVARLRGQSPERYHIEAQPTAAARQRLLELLDGLRAGDELRVAALDPLGADVGDAAQRLLDLAARGVGLVLVQHGGGTLDLGASASVRDLLTAMAESHRRRRQAAHSKAPPVPRELLSEVEIEDVRRLSQAGMSLRRIGLIYRRSPKCIAELLCGPTDPVLPAQARQRA